METTWNSGEPSQCSRSTKMTAGAHRWLMQEGPKEPKPTSKALQGCPASVKVRVHIILTVKYGGSEIVWGVSNFRTWTFCSIAENLAGEWPDIKLKLTRVLQQDDGPEHSSNIPPQQSVTNARLHLLQKEVQPNFLTSGWFGKRFFLHCSKILV